MGKRMGSPTEDPKENYTGIRLSGSELKKIKICMDKTGMTKTELSGRGLS